MMTSVIRVKRRRSSEPAEALLLARKKAKNDCDLRSMKSDMADVIKIEEKVFRFAGTVEPQIAYSDHVVAERVKEAILHRRMQKSCMKVSSMKRKLPRFVSDTLPHMKQIRDSTVAMCHSFFREKCSKRDVSALPSDAATDLSYKCSESCFEQCDTRKEKTTFNNGVENSSCTQSIMCNNIKMFHEKLNISESLEKKDAVLEFVYDLYYCKDPSSHWDMSDLLYVQPYRYDVEELLGSSDDEYLDDEDDSNDEENWRNDYPDEDNDDSSGSSSTSEDEWQMFVKEEDELDNDMCDPDGGDADDDGDLAQSQRDDQAPYDYHDEVESEVYNCYDDDDDHGEKDNAGNVDNDDG